MVDWLNFKRTVLSRINDNFTRDTDTVVVKQNRSRTEKVLASVLKT